MKAVFFKRFIPIFLCAVLLLTVCSACSGETVPESSLSSESNEVSSTSPSDTAEIEYAPFTLLYTLDKPLNPLVCTDIYNEVLGSLMYESLFALDSNFSPIPILAEEYTTEDGITYQFTIKSGVYFHDGTELTANDVAYSIRQASYSTKYSSRLADFYSCNPTGSYTFTLVLEKANYMLPSLLDIPIIKNLSLDSAVPAGTGPYIYESGDSPRLIAFNKHRDAGSLPVSEILLKAASADSIVAEFTAGQLSLVPTDPTGTDTLEIRADHEARYYDTTALQYIGFNQHSDKSLLSNPDFRRAVSYAVDRKQIVNTIFEGYAVSAPFGIHPSLSFYDSDLEKDSVYSLQSLSSILNSMNFEDSDGNNWLEYNSEEVVLKLIVNSDNSRKVDSARSIVNTLRNVGINITLSVLPWNDYIYALKEGNFDLYYAESQLTADFDLSEILTAGGSINYCGVENTEYSKLIDAYLSSSSDDERSAAFKELAQYIQNDASIIPILFKKHSVLSQRDMIFGLKPTQSSIVAGFVDCKIN